MAKNIFITESQLRFLKESLLTETKNLVDNFDLVGNLINLTDPDKFFFVQIVKRWKDNKDKGMNRATEHNYHGGAAMGTFADGTAFKVHSKAELDTLKPQIIAYCDKNNARAYVCCNPRSESAINTYLPIFLQKQAKKYGGKVPSWDANYGFEHLSGQPKKYGTDFPDRLRFFLDIDTTKNAYYMPKKLHVDKRTMRVDDINYPQLKNCEAGFVESGAELLFPKYPNQEQAIQSLGGLNVWNETHNILNANNIPIEVEYETPSKGLHVVIADISAIQNFPKVEQDLRVFDDNRNMGRVQLVHANLDGKLILYSNVDTKGY